MTADTVTSQSGAWAMVPVWILSEGLTGAELAVYVSLRSFADRSGAAHPHVKTIAGRGGVSERTAERAIATLRSKRLITTAQVRRPDGSIQGCNYHIRDTPGATVAPGPDEDVATPPDEDVATLPTRLSGQEEHTNETHQLEESAGPRKRGTRLPDGWQPSLDLIAWAKAECPSVDGRTETEKFCNHWWSKTGRDATKLDWGLTWKNWLLRTRDEFGNSRSASNGRASPRPSTADQRVGDALALAVQLQSEERSRDTF